jgi:hypothetical protein
MHDRHRLDEHCLPSRRASTCGRAHMKGRPDAHNIASGRAMYIYIFLHYSLIYSISNSFSHIFLLNNLFLWTIKHSLHILLSFLVVKLILVIYPLNLFLKW